MWSLIKASQKKLPCGLIIFEGFVRSHGQTLRVFASKTASLWAYGPMGLWANPVVAKKTRTKWKLGPPAGCETGTGSTPHGESGHVPPCFSKKDAGNREVPGPELLFGLLKRNQERKAKLICVTMVTIKTWYTWLLQTRVVKRKGGDQFVAKGTAPRFRLAIFAHPSVLAAKASSVDA